MHSILMILQHFGSKTIYIYALKNHKTYYNKRKSMFFYQNYPKNINLAYIYTLPYTLRRQSFCLYFSKVKWLPLQPLQKPIQNEQNSTPPHQFRLIIALFPTLVKKPQGFSLKSTVATPGSQTIYIYIYTKSIKNYDFSWKTLILPWKS